MVSDNFEGVNYKWTGRKMNEGFLRFHITDHYIEELHQLDDIITKELYISGVTQKSLEYFVEYYAQRFPVLCFTACNTVKDFGCLESLENIEYLIIEWNTKIEKLWNMNYNHNLRGIRLEDCKKVKSFEEIVNAPHLEELVLQESVNSMLGSNKWIINSLHDISTTSQLKRLGLIISGVKDSSIESLLNMKQLEMLHIITSLFSFEDFARLNAVLKQTEIQPNKPFYFGTTNDDNVLVIGKNRSIKRNSPKLAEYQKKWDSIISKYQ
ncbi:hypothetical protein [Bacteroides fragilis]|uniref:hypothetical protein n=1 Tax=Bacteroides fragilis TaxID=817 RepID=UPI00202DDC48|nr:hypothetical protein [Bacteroides fragilis]MCM0295786.1 hypothetical protein [Bacteroides fragilis]WMI95307.1 hypothetical protein BFGS084_02731 [Bacteroides fragilis]